MILRGVLVLLLTVLRSANGHEESGDRSFDTVPDRVAFGSCAKQDKKEELKRIWDAVLATQPDVWLWTGDAIYPSRKASLELLKKCYKKQREVQGYTKLRQHVSVLDGTIDDHDYGVNDGGKSYPLKEGSKQLFLDFIGVSKTSERRKRDGTYTSLTFGKPPHQVKVILLDTRYNRDDHLLAVMGKYDFPLSGIVFSVIRTLTSFIGIGAQQEGDILGPYQWKWLQNQLLNSQANVHIVVSSIQVMTSLVLVESWGRFPVSQKQLFDLFKKTQPKGLLLLSGDVHFAQILGRDDAVVEVTSSGLTHSQSDYLFLWTLVETFLLPNATRYYEGTNFGLLDFSFSDLSDGVVESNVICRVLSRGGGEKMRATLKFRSDEDVSERMKGFDEVVPVTPRRSFCSMVLRGVLVALFAMWTLQVGVVIVVKFWNACRRPQKQTSKLV